MTREVSMSVDLLPIGVINLLQVIAGSGKVEGSIASRTASPAPARIDTPQAQRPVAAARRKNDEEDVAAAKSKNEEEEKWDDKWGVSCFGLSFEGCYGDALESPGAGSNPQGHGSVGNSVHACLTRPGIFRRG